MFPKKKKKILNLKNFQIKNKQLNLENLIYCINYTFLENNLTTLRRVNIDGAIFSSQHEAQVGIIIRDDQGLVIVALCKNIK